MTPVRKTAQDNTFTKWVLGLFTVAIVGVVGILWDSNRQIAEMKTEDRARQEKINDIKESVNRIEEDVTGIKEKDMQDIKDRLKTLEIKNEDPK